MKRTQLTETDALQTSASIRCKGSDYLADSKTICAQICTSISNCLLEAFLDPEPIVVTAKRAIDAVQDFGRESIQKAQRIVKKVQEGIVRQCYRIECKAASTSSTTSSTDNTSEGSAASGSASPDDGGGEDDGDDGDPDRPEPQEERPSLESTMWPTIEPESKPQPHQPSTAEECFFAGLINAQTALPPMEFYITCNGVNQLLRGDVSMMQGQKGQGKSHAVYAYCIALLKGSFGVLQSIAEHPRILLFDTEQNPSEVQQLRAMLLRCAGRDPLTDWDDFKVCTLMDVKKSQRCEVIKAGVEALKPDFVAIDGARDLLVDFNNPVETDALMEFLCTLAQQNQTHIMLVLHENPTPAGDGKARGHLGTELSNKGSDQFRCKEDREQGCHIVSAVNGRRGRAQEWAFRFTGDGSIEPVEDVQPRRLKTPKKSKDKQLEETILSAFNGLTFAPKKDVVSALVTGGVPTPTAYRTIDKAKALGIIEEADNGLKLRISVTNTESNE